MIELIYKFKDSDGKLLLLDISEISFVKSTVEGTTIYTKSGNQIDTNYDFDLFEEYINNNTMELTDFTSVSIDDAIK